MVNIQHVYLQDCTRYCRALMMTWWLISNVWSATEPLYHYKTIQCYLPGFLIQYRSRATSRVVACGLRDSHVWHVHFSHAVYVLARIYSHICKILVITPPNILEWNTTVLCISFDWPAGSISWERVFMPQLSLKIFVKLCVRFWNKTKTILPNHEEFESLFLFLEPWVEPQRYASYVSLVTMR